MAAAAAAVLWIRRASRRQARLPFRTSSALARRNPFTVVRVALSPHTSSTHTHPSIHPLARKSVPSLSHTDPLREKTSRRDISRRCHVSQRCRPLLPPLWCTRCVHSPVIIITRSLRKKKKDHCEALIHDDIPVHE